MSDEASRRREASRKRRARRKRASADEDERPTEDDAPADEDDAEEPSDAEETKAPKRKKRRKRKKKPPADDRPPFAQRYPRHERLDALVVAFEAGHFAEVRTGTEELFAKDLPDDVMDAARDLRRRIEPSPTSIYLWAIGVALLALLYGFYISHQH